MQRLPSMKPQVALTLTVAVSTSGDGFLESSAIPIHGPVNHTFHPLVATLVPIMRYPTKGDLCMFSAQLLEK